MVDPPGVRSTTNAPSVTLVTVNLPVPGLGDVTVTVHTPTASVVHDVAGVAVPVPDHVYAIVAPSTGSLSLRCAVIVNTCGAPTAFVADSDTITRYVSHVFDVATGGTTRSVTGRPSTVVPTIAVTVNNNVPGRSSSVTR